MEIYSDAAAFAWGEVATAAPAEGVAGPVEGGGGGAGGLSVGEAIGIALPVAAVVLSVAGWACHKVAARVQSESLNANTCYKLYHVPPLSPLTGEVLAVLLVPVA